RPARRNDARSPEETPPGRTAPEPAKPPGAATAGAATSPAATDSAAAIVSRPAGALILLLHPVDQLIEPFAAEQIRERVRPVAAHLFRIFLHDLTRRPHERSEVDLVDDEVVRAHDARAALARNFFALRHVDDVDEPVDKLRGKGRRQIVAAALDEDDVQFR